MSRIIHPEFLYTDLRLGSLRTLIRTPDINYYIKRKASRPQDVHVALYRYDRAIVDHCENHNGSTRGFEGLCYADFVPFEFDGIDIAASCRLAKEIMAVLQGPFGLPDEAIGLFYSGNRSIHMMVHTACFGTFAPDAHLDRILFEIVLRVLDGTSYLERVGEYDSWRSTHLDLEM